MSFRLSQIGPGTEDQALRQMRIQSEQPDKRAQEFDRIDEGIVVTGGARLPWYGCHRCTANLAGYAVPASWRLVAKIDGPRTAYRAERLRIWRVSQAELTAGQLLADVSEEWPPRIQLLQSLVDEARYPVAVAVGRRLALTVGPDHADEVLALTATACARAGKQHCARELLARRVEEARTGDVARVAITELVRSGGTYATIRLAREEIERFHVRFPSEPALSFPDVESGFAEAVALYHQNRPAEAEPLFRSVAERPEWQADLRRRALYFRGLSLFRAGDPAAAARVVEAYHAAHGQHDAWVELRYREGDVLRLSDPVEARRLFEEGGGACALEPLGRSQSRSQSPPGTRAAGSIARPLPTSRLRAFLPPWRTMRRGRPASSRAISLAGRHPP